MNNSQTQEANRIKDLHHIKFKNGFAVVSESEIVNLMSINGIEYFGAIDLENQLELGRIYGMTVGYGINTGKWALNIL